jgi:hypothetical protein
MGIVAIIVVIAVQTVHEKIGVQPAGANILRFSGSIRRNEDQLSHLLPPFLGLLPSWSFVGEDEESGATRPRGLLKRSYYFITDPPPRPGQAKGYIGMRVFLTALL